MRAFQERSRPQGSSQSSAVLGRTTMRLCRALQLLSVLLSLLAGSCHCQALPRWWAAPAATPSPRSPAASLPPLPPLQACSALAALSSSPNATVALAAARAAGMGEQLNDASSPLTLFVPTDRAWILLCSALRICRDTAVCALDSCRDQLTARPQALAATLQARRPPGRGRCMGYSQRLGCACAAGSTRALCPFPTTP